MTCRDAIRAVFPEDGTVLKTNDVVDRVYARHPHRPWTRGTIRTYLIGLSRNHSSGHFYPSLQRHAFLHSLGNGRYQLWDPSRDGASPRPVAAGSTQRKRVVAGGTKGHPQVGSPSNQTAGAHPVRRGVERDWRPARAAVDEEARADLVRQLVHDIAVEPFQPRYRRKPRGKPVTGWRVRYLSYFWPTPPMDADATLRELTPWFAEAGALSEALQTNDGWEPAERKHATALACRMLKWGRVPQKNGFSPDTVEAVFRRAHGMPSAGPAPMNSGWTKVAALATAYLEGNPSRYPHVIWDSRVSTALTSRLDRAMIARGMRDPSRVFPRIGAVAGRGGSRPRPLQLRWARAYASWSSQEAGSELVREIRDVLDEERHALMPGMDGGEEPWTVRGVESVLFMDGY